MRNSTTTVQVVCAVVFLTFVFTYLFFFQPDLLALAQHVWSGGQTTYNAWVGAMLITLALWFIQLGVKAAFPLPRTLKALAYFPSMLFLGVMTCMSPESHDNMSIGHWSWISVVLLVAYFVIVMMLKELALVEHSKKREPVFGMSALSNFSIMFLMICMTISIGNTERKVHEELHMEVLLRNGCYEEALDYSRKISAQTPTTTFLTTYALAKKRELGERYFEFNPVGGANSLIPVDGGEAAFSLMDDMVIWRLLGGIPREEITNATEFLQKLHRQGVAKPVARDYLLIAHLAGKDVKGFVKELQMQLRLDTLKSETEVDSTLTTLPKHYREALVQYTHTHSNRVVSYTDEVLDADYKDFTAITRRKFRSQEEKRKALRAFEGTFWYYAE